MPIEMLFTPKDAERLIAFKPLGPGEMTSTNVFIEYDILAHCLENDSGGSVCFVEKGYLQHAGKGNVMIPYDWVTEENNYNEIDENGQISVSMTHTEWGEGELLIIHRNASNISPTLPSGS